MKRINLFLALAIGCIPASSAAPARAQVHQASVPLSIAQAVAATVEGKATGVILVAKNGRLLWVGGVGDAAHHVPAPAPGTIFDALSIGKTFTAIAIQRLADQGKLQLSAPLRRYLPELPENLSAITVQNCLDNASGWGPYVNDKGDFDPETANQLLRDLATAERKHAVGEYGYSNTGFQALGLVIQRVTGRPFEQAMRDLVFRPAKLRSTDFLGAPGLRHRLVATGFANGKPTGSPRSWPAGWQLLGSAGIATNVYDLYRFNRTFLAGNGLGAAGRTRMRADGVPTKGAAPYREPGRSDITYGSGLYHWRDAQGRRVHFHGGDGDYGFHDVMYWREDGDLFIAGLFNSGSPAGTFDRSAFINAFAAAAEQLSAQ